MDITTFNPSEVVDIILEWTNAVNALIHQVTGWAKEKGWEVRLSDRQVTEEALGTYAVPVLEIDTPEGRLVLEPIARIVFGGRGRVDLYAWPTLFRVMLLRRTSDAAWIVRTDSGVKWPQPWSRDTFYTLAEELLNAL